MIASLTATYFGPSAQLPIVIPAFRLIFLSRLVVFRLSLAMRLVRLGREKRLEVVRLRKTDLGEPAWSQWGSHRNKEEALKTKLCSHGFHSPSASGFLLRRLGWSFRASLISSTIPAHGA